MSLYPSTGGVHVGGVMTSDAERFKQLYDVERHVMATDGGILVEDPYPAFAELLAKAPSASSTNAAIQRSVHHCARLGENAGWTSAR